MPFLKSFRTTSVAISRIESSKRNGLRKLILTDNDLSSRYTGEWKNDKRHGKGSNIRKNFLYEGDWSNDKRHGYGLLSKILEDKRLIKIYSGYWKEGKKEGFGRLWYDNGDYYEGTFVKNKREGFGRRWTSDSTFYQGYWKNDFYDGEGLLLLANGNRYEGHFFHGMKEGSGIFYHIKTGQLQEGCWLKDKCIVSTIRDMHWRQSASTPTPYPIPKNEVGNPEEIFHYRLKEEETLLSDSTISTTYQNNNRQNDGCSF